MKKEVVFNIKKAYLTPFGIAINGLTILFYGILLPLNNTYQRLPIYIIVFIALWLLINIISICQERNKRIDLNKKQVLTYMAVNILCGYSLIIAMSSIYFIGATVNEFNVFNYWLYLLIILFVSWIGFHLFCISNFKIINLSINNLIKIIGIILTLISLISLLYLGLIVPVTDGENNFIFCGLIALLCVYALLIRSYYNYSWYLYLVKNGEKETEREKRR
ncbi:DUF5079 family protein [Staphylococcus caprae]|uniref:DUF5079 family protein n=1 Tax=Staphylococcus caprae TaxID=29380 RepID=UPI003B221853